MSDRDLSPGLANCVFALHKADYHSPVYPPLRAFTSFSAALKYANRKVADPVIVETWHNGQCMRLERYLQLPCVRRGSAA